MKNLEYYMSLDYAVKIKTEYDFDGNKYYVAIHEELNGLEGVGETQVQAMEDLQVAKENWFEFNLELGRNIPEPKDSRDHEITKITLRLPYTLNEQVEGYMNYEGMSKNNAINSLIAKGLVSKDYNEVDRVINKLYSAIQIIFYKENKSERQLKRVNSFDDNFIEMKSEYKSPSQSIAFTN